jgi:hypothetical protein
MKTAALGQAKIETTARNARLDRVIVPTAETSLTCSTPEQQLRSWRVGEAFTATREAIAQWGRRVGARTKPNTLRDPRDVLRTRAEVQADRSKAFWWASAVASLRRKGSRPRAVEVREDGRAFLDHAAPQRKGEAGADRRPHPTPKPTQQAAAPIPTSPLQRLRTGATRTE